jgi:DNA-binding XRE family transcriptional regulator
MLDPHRVARRQSDGARLRAWRQRQGLTLEQLGQRLGRPRATVHRWESGRTQAPPDVLSLIDDPAPVALSHAEVGLVVRLALEDGLRVVPCPWCQRTAGEHLDTCAGRLAVRLLEQP